MRRSLSATGRTLTGGRPVLSACVVSTAAGTAALQSSGVDGWWVPPVVLLALIGTWLRRGPR